MPTASEILQRLNAGEVVFLNSEDAGEFMLECARHNLSCGAIRMSHKHGRTRMQLTSEGRKRIEARGNKDAE